MLNDTIHISPPPPYVNILSTLKFHYYSNYFIIIALCSGAIRTVMSLDYETMKSMNFSVRVTDLGKPRLSSEMTAAVHISVLDVNDCAPVFTQTDYNASVLLPTYKNVAVIQVI